MVIAYKSIRDLVISGQYLKVICRVVFGSCFLFGLNSALLEQGFGMA